MMLPSRAFGTRPNDVVTSTASVNWTAPLLGTLSQP